MSTELVPSQEKGKSVDLEEVVTAASREEAIQLFQQGVNRLSRPALWAETAGGISASFSIAAKEEQTIEPGDHIRITIPGPGLGEGDGDDWVRVETVDKDFDDQYDESYGILLLVCANPNSETDAIAHFFAEGASSSFLLKRKDKVVTAYYKGRNETPNTEKLVLTDKIRNMVVAGGALAGISELQWTALLRGLLSTK